MIDKQKLIDEQIGRNIAYGEDGMSLYKQIGILREAVEALRAEVEKLSKKPVALQELDALTAKVATEKARVKPKADQRKKSKAADKA